MDSMNRIDWFIFIIIISFIYLIPIFFSIFVGLVIADIHCIRRHVVEEYKRAGVEKSYIFISIVVCIIVTTAVLKHEQTIDLLIMDSRRSALREKIAVLKTEQEIARLKKLLEDSKNLTELQRLEIEEQIMDIEIKIMNKKI